MSRTLHVEIDTETGLGRIGGVPVKLIEPTPEQLAPWAKALRDRIDDAIIRSFTDTDNQGARI